MCGFHIPLEFLTFSRSRVSRFLFVLPVIDTSSSALTLLNTYASPSSGAGFLLPLNNSYVNDGEHTLSTDKQRLCHIPVPSLGLPLDEVVVI